MPAGAATASAAAPEARPKPNFESSWPVIRTRGCGPRRPGVTRTRSRRRPPDAGADSQPGGRAGRSRRRSRRRSGRRRRRAPARARRRTCCCRGAPAAPPGTPAARATCELAAGRHVEAHALLVGQSGPWPCTGRPWRRRPRRRPKPATRLPAARAAGAPRRRRTAACPPRRPARPGRPRRRASRPSATDRGVSGSRLATGSGPSAGPGAAPGRDAARAAARHIDSGAATPSRPRPMASPIRAASTSHSRAWRQLVGATSSAEHPAVVVEAVERAGQPPHPGRDLVRRPLAAAASATTSGSSDEAAQQLELALVDEQGQVDLARAGRRSMPRSAAARSIDGDAGVRVLHVVDGVLHRLAPRRRRGRASSPGRCELTGESSRVASGPMLVDERRRASTKLPARFDIAAAPTSETIWPSRISSRSGSTPRACDAGLQAGDLAVVVGAEDVDHPVEPADQELVAVVGEVAGRGRWRRRRT